MKKNAKKILILTLCAALLVGGSVLGTLAALNGTSNTVQNTFAAGKIFTNNDAFKLYEHKLTGTADAPTLDLNTEVKGDATHPANQYTIVPKVNVPKDPTVSIDGNTVAVYVFVKATPSAKWNSNMTYGFDNGWTALPGHAGVYYQALAADSAIGTATTLNVLANKTVTVPDLSNADVTAADGATLSFTAYACQQAGYVDDTATHKSAVQVAFEANFPTV